MAGNRPGSRPHKDGLGRAQTRGGHGAIAGRACRRVPLHLRCARSCRCVPRDRVRTRCMPCAAVAGAVRAVAAQAACGGVSGLAWGLHPPVGYTLSTRPAGPAPAVASAQPRRGAMPMWTATACKSRRPGPAGAMPISLVPAGPGRCHGRDRDPANRDFPHHGRYRRSRPPSTATEEGTTVREHDPSRHERRASGTSELEAVAEEAWEFGANALHAARDWFSGRRAHETADRGEGPPGDRARARPHGRGTPRDDGDPHARGTGRRGRVPHGGQSDRSQPHGRGSARRGPAGEPGSGG